MTLRRSLRFLPLLALLPLAACEQGGVGSSSDGEDAQARAEYSREMMFVAGDATAAAVLDFRTVDAGSEVRRSARAWAEAGSGWTPLYDLSWEDAAVRRAWRLVPHGPIRLRVGLNDEIEAILVRGEEADVAALETGDVVDEWTPLRDVQFLFREASLSFGGGEPVSGWLVDAHFGVAASTGDASTGGGAPNGLDPADVADTAALPLDQDTPPEDSIGVAIEADDTGAAETAGGPGRPGRVRALRGLLVSEDGDMLVLADTEDGMAAWLWTVDQESTIPRLTLTAVPGEQEAWILASDSANALSGRLEVMDEEPVPLSPRMVRGELDAAGTRLELHGVLRPLESAD